MRMLHTQDQADVRLVVVVVVFVYLHDVRRLDGVTIVTVTARSAMRIQPVFKVCLTSSQLQLLQIQHVFL